MHEKQKPEEQQWRGAQGLKTCSGLRWMLGMGGPSDSRTCIIVTHTHTHRAAPTHRKKKGTSHDVKYIKSFLIQKDKGRGRRREGRKWKTARKDVVECMHASQTYITHGGGDSEGMSTCDK